MTVKHFYPNIWQKMKPLHLLQGTINYVIECKEKQDFQVRLSCYNFDCELTGTAPELSEERWPAQRDPEGRHTNYGKY